jgi:hypothetical protein
LTIHEFVVHKHCSTADDYENWCLMKLDTDSTDGGADVFAGASLHGGGDLISDGGAKKLDTDWTLTRQTEERTSLHGGGNLNSDGGAKKLDTDWTLTRQA